MGATGIYPKEIANRIQYHVKKFIHKMSFSYPKIGISRPISTNLRASWG